jgi:hypothetical protein
VKKAKPGDPKVMSIGPKPDATGLQIGVASNAASMKTVTVTISSTVAFDVIAGDNPTRASRGLDTQPYWGGSYMENWGPIGDTPSNACTMRFSAIRNLLPVMLTAAHCGGGGDVWRLSNGDYYGQEQEITTARHDYDAMLVGVPSNQGAIYDGPSFYDGDTNNGKPIAGSGATVVGDRFCTSGGPVFQPTGPNNSQATARGTISTIPGQSVYWRPCQGVPGVPNDQAGRHCSYSFNFPDIRYQVSPYSSTYVLTYG